MKRVILLLLLSMLLCGCDEQADVPEEAVTETSPPVETTLAETDGDVELKTLEAVLTDGETLRLSVMGKQDTDTGKYGVREISVYRGGQQIQTLEMMTAIEKDGISGIALGYTESFALEDTVKLKDVDFDGNPDLEVCGWCPNNAIPYYYWIWDPDTEQFQYAFLLQLREVNAEKRQLIAWYKVENGLYHTDYYQVNDQKELELLQRDVEDVRPN